MILSRFRLHLFNRLESHLQHLFSAKVGPNQVSFYFFNSNCIYHILKSSIMCIMFLNCLIILENFAWIIPSFFNIPINATCNILTAVSSAQNTKVKPLVLVKIPQSYITHFWHWCSVSDKPGPLKNISESLSLKIESICGLCSYTFDLTFVSYPAIKQSRLFSISWSVLFMI